MTSMSTTRTDDGAAAPPAGAALDAAVLWRQFAAPLRAFVARRVPPGVEADDVVQDVFLRVVQHLPELRRTERPEAWLFQVARNALHDVLRARMRRDGRTDALEADPPAEPRPSIDWSAEAELAPCLTGMIARLAEPYRTALALTTLDGVTQVEAARRLGVSISGMKSRVQRGRGQLKALLVQCCAIALDVRGGVTDFHPRPGGCGSSSTPPCSPSACRQTPARR